MHPFARGTLACAVVLSYSVHSRGARTQPEGGAGGSKHWEIPQLRSVRRRKFNLFFGASGESLTVEGVPKVSINAGRDPPALQNVLPQGWFFGFSSAFFYFFFWPSIFFFLFSPIFILSFNSTCFREGRGRWGEQGDGRRRGGGKGASGSCCSGRGCVANRRVGGGGGTVVGYGGVVVGERRGDLRQRHGLRLD